MLSIDKTVELVDDSYYTLDGEKFKYDKNFMYGMITENLGVDVLGVLDINPSELDFFKDLYYVLFFISENETDEDNKELFKEIMWNLSIGIENAEN